MKRRQPLTIPRHWTPEQTLSVVAFLEDVLSAVWDVHGDALDEYISMSQPPESSQQPPKETADVRCEPAMSDRLTF